MPEKMIFEIDTQFGLDLTGRVFHRIDGLKCAIGQTIHQICRGDFPTVQIINEPCFLLPQFGKLLFVFRPLLELLFQMLLKRGTKEDRPFGIAGFGRN